MKPLRLFLVLLAGLPGMASGARLETQWAQQVTLSSGVLANATAQPKEKLIGLLMAPAAARVRVVVAKAALGEASKVRFVSEKDGQSQTLDAAQLAMWSHTSALFNGSTVRVELVVAPGDRDVSIQVDQMLAFSDEPTASPDKGDQLSEPIPETLCGTDNRVASTDNRSGRIAGGCTGWLTANGAVLTAGHCGIVAGNILEVRVPASGANGNTVASAVQDQFPVLANSITTVNSGVGNDYTVCRVGPNNLNQTAHQLHGFFRMTRDLPAVGSLLRVTGCGIDNTPVGSEPTVCGNFNSMGVCTHFGLNAQNQTQQTSTGSFTSETGTGTVISLQYSVDTEPANSGSPIIWEANGFTVGIHTAGGCTSSGGANNGTSFELNALENAIDAVPGANCRYLDRVKAPSGTEDGGVFQPFDTVAEAVNAVPAGGIISVVTGSYSAAGVTINKSMTLRAPVGAVTFGN